MFVRNSAKAYLWLEQFHQDSWSRADQCVEPCDKQLVWLAGLTQSDFSVIQRLNFLASDCNMKIFLITGVPA
jgi:hypothetical protein